MTKLRVLASTIFIVMCLSQTSPEVIRLWHWENAHQAMLKIPTSSINDQLSGIREEKPNRNTENCYTLSKHKLTVYRCGKNTVYEAWQSPESWIVTEAIQADLNRDGTNEIAVVAWRPFTPWPVDSFLPYGGRIAGFQSEAGLSAHLILIGWVGDEYRELWAGSALANPISDIRAVDIDGDGYEELIALEGEYDAAVETGSITLWKWQGFGFTLLDRMEGNYSGYAVYQTEHQTSILAN